MKLIVGALVVVFLVGLVCADTTTKRNTQTLADKWSIKGAVKSVGGALKKGAGAVANGVKSGANTVANGVKSGANTVANGVTDAYNKIKNEVNDLTNGIKDQVNKLKDGAQSVGNSLGGLKDIKDKFSGVGNKLKNAANDFKSFMERIGESVKDMAEFVVKLAKKLAPGCKPSETAKKIKSKLSGIEALDDPLMCLLDFFIETKMIQVNHVLSMPSFVELESTTSSTSETSTSVTTTAGGDPIFSVECKLRYHFCKLFQLVQRSMVQSLAFLDCSPPVPPTPEALAEYGACTATQIKLGVVGIGFDAIALGLQIDMYGKCNVQI